MKKGWRKIPTSLTIDTETEEEASIEEGDSTATLTDPNDPSKKIVHIFKANPKPITLNDDWLKNLKKWDNEEKT